MAGWPSSPSCCAVGKLAAEEAGEFHSRTGEEQRAEEAADILSGLHNGSLAIIAGLSGSDCDLVLVLGVQTDWCALLPAVLGLAHAVPVFTSSCCLLPVSRTSRQQLTLASCKGMAEQRPPCCLIASVAGQGLGDWR